GVATVTEARRTARVGTEGTDRWLLRQTLGVDCLILALVLPAALGRPVTPSGTLIDVLVVFLALCYWAVDLLARPGVLGWLPRGGTHATDEGEVAGGAGEGRGYRIKLLLLLAIIALVVVLPTMVA